MTMMYDRSFTAEYADFGDGAVYDVSFELTEGAEDLLFTGLAEQLYESASDGYFDAHLVHLYHKLSEQYVNHPPWIELESSVRTYDLELTESDYSKLNDVIGQVIGDMVSVDQHEKFEDLIDAWSEITQSMVDDEPNFVDPDNGRFVEYTQDDTVIVFENEYGEQWYRCTECETMYSEISDDHVEQHRDDSGGEN